MARRHNRRRSVRRERKMEHRQWFSTQGFADQTVTLKTGADTDNVVKVAVDPLKGDDCTILRTRGYIIPYVNADSAGINACLGGIVLPNKTANNASASDLPNPLNDADTTDWFAWMPFYMPPDTGSEPAEEEVVLTAAYPLEIDSKAKRIMEAAESVVWILGFAPNGAVAAKRVGAAYNLRTLVGY